MSVVSSRVSSVSSILKSPGVRSQLVRQVYFKLPKDIKDIIYNFETGKAPKNYHELIRILRDSPIIKDNDLHEFLVESRQCVSLLGFTHKVLVETILQIKWVDRSQEVVSAYKYFLEDLICMHIYHGKSIIDNLIEQFKPAENGTAEWEAGKCKKADAKRLQHIHDVLCKILRVVPMSGKLLLQSVRSRFPYIIHGTHIHEVYIYALLEISNYAPHLRSDLLSLIVNRLMILDVNIPQLNEDNSEDDVMDEDDCDKSSSVEDHDKENKKAENPTAHTLDVCMEQILNYIHDSCYVDGVLQIESLKSLYSDLIQIFETIILPTHASQYVQYIMFYICSFKTAVVEAFIDLLWKKVCNPNTPCIIRQTSALYIATLLTAASFVSIGLVKIVQSKLVNWIHNYINIQDCSNDSNDNLKEHAIFYSVCQALFLIVTVRHKDFIDKNSGMLCLHELDLPKIVTCRLNPLKFCQPQIVHDFADVTRTYQLVYCYTVIENNARNQLPIIHDSTYSDVSFDNFLPYGAYTLPLSGQRIIPFLYNSTKDMENRSINRHSIDVTEYMMD